MFNSALIYELAVLKQYVEPLLFGIPRDCDEYVEAEPLLFGIDKNEPEYAEAKRLLKFFDYFLPVPSEAVPHNSILREFIGGSCLDV